MTEVIGVGWIAYEDIGTLIYREFWHQKKVWITIRDTSWDMCGPIGPTIGERKLNSQPIQGYPHMRMLGFPNWEWA